jgi:hypothetical protein
MDKVGRICFIIGVIVSIIAGFITSNWIFFALTILGLIVGFLNVGAKETKDFLFAAIALVILAAFGAVQFNTVPGIGDYLGRIYTALLAFVSPATLIVALRSLFTIAKD